MTTQQEFFDRTVTLLIEQGKPAADNVGCRYRAGDNLKCAVGHWIPDAEYAANPQEGAIEERFTLWPTIEQLVKDVGLNLLQDIQTAHDKPAFSSNDGPWLPQFLKKAEAVGQKYNLNTEICNVL